MELTLRGSVSHGGDNSLVLRASPGLEVGSNARVERGGR